MNLQEIKKIGNIKQLDTARVILNEYGVDVVDEINLRIRERFATTLAAVFIFDAIIENIGEEQALEDIRTLDDAKENIDAHWDCLVESGMKPIVGGYHKTASKVLSLINRLRKEQGE